MLKRKQRAAGEEKDFAGSGANAGGWSWCPSQKNAKTQKKREKKHGRGNTQKPKNIRKVLRGFRNSSMVG